MLEDNKDHEDTSENDRGERDRALALRYVARAMIRAEVADQEKMTAIATALDHGASLGELADVTGYSVATLRRIATRLRRGDKIEGSNG